MRTGAYSRSTVGARHGKSKQLCRLRTQSLLPWAAGSSNSQMPPLVSSTTGLMMGSASGELRPVLVTTALEATWPKRQPVVFLGEWCLRYSRREAWQGLDYSVAPYHWDERDQIPEDLDYICDVYERLLPELALALNRIHGVDYSTRYWRIVAGWWLFFFSQIFFDRWQVLRDADARYPGSQLQRVIPSAAPPASLDMAAFLGDSREDSWNERLSADIAAQWTDITITELTSPHQAVKSSREDQDRRRSRRNMASRFLYSGLRRAINWAGNRKIFYGEGVALQLDSLSLEVKCKLAVLLRQLPSVSVTEISSAAAPETSWRLWDLPLEKGVDTFAEALAAAVPQYLPTCYLEGYAAASVLAERSWWRRRPRVIMTANAFSGDDRWAMWAAKQSELGTKLVIAQHGGHYGSGMWSATQMHEIAISDRYLSWGWDDPKEPRIYPAPATKLIGIKKEARENGGTCLLVAATLPRQSDLVFSVPVASQFEAYIDEQFEFVRALRADAKDQLVARQSQHDHGWDVAERWRDRESLVKTDSGEQPIRRLLKNTRLFVATYNATTFLESFAYGVPTVIFWDPKFWELSDEASPYYDLLRSAAVLFDDPISCAEHVNAIWDDVPGWWLSPSVQEAVATFSERFAYVGETPLRELKAALTTW